MKINLIISFILTTSVYLIGGFDIAMQTLMICIIIDYITGILNAWFEKKLNSKIGAKGIIKKMGYILIIVLATQFDRLLGDTGYVRIPTIYLFVANEGLSIVENWAKMGLPIPKKLVEKLAQLKESG